MIPIIVKTPFQVAAVDYIREVYPNWESEGRNGPGAGLVAFMLGVTSHYITDINWHGLEVIPAGEGIIRTMGYMDFNCTDGDLCSIAHSAADTGGEFAAAVSMNLSWYPAVSIIYLFICLCMFIIYMYLCDRINGIYLWTTW